MYPLEARSSRVSVSSNIFAGCVSGALLTEQSTNVAGILNMLVLLGRELGSYALDEYTSVKAVHWNFGEKLDWPL